MGKLAKGVGEWEPLRKDSRYVACERAWGKGPGSRWDGLSGLVRPRPHQVLLAPGSAYISMPTCDLTVLSSFLQEFQCRLKRGGKKCETLGCPERGQLGLCSSQNILVPAAEASLSVWLPVCPVVPQLQEVSGSCAWPGVMMPLRMKQKQESDRMPCPRLCSSPCPLGEAVISEQ